MLPGCIMLPDQHDVMFPVGKYSYRQGKDAGTTEPKSHLATLNNFGTLFVSVALAYLFNRPLSRRGINPIKPAHHQCQSNDWLFNNQRL